MNTLTNIWNSFLENKIYIDLVFLVSFLFATYLLLHYALVKFIMYLAGCWVVGGKLGELSYWLAKKFK